MRGGPLITIADIEARTTPEPNTGCWLWFGEQTTNGYGRIELRGRVLRAHRLAFTLAFGPIPPGRLVCHRCDQRVCANPAHLYAGTARDNVLDMVRRSRTWRPPPPGQPGLHRDWHGRFLPRSTAVPRSTNERQVQNG